MALIGAHVSTAGGLVKFLERAEKLKCESAQIFLGSSRMWRLKTLTQPEIAEYLLERRRLPSLSSIVAHNSYLLNLSTPDEKLRAQSVNYFLKIYEQCEALSLDGLITHPGSHGGFGETEGILRTIKSFNEIVSSTRGMKTKILIENTAGQGFSVGYTIEHLRDILEGLEERKRVAFCVDTQHAFAAGYDLSTEDGYLEFFSLWDEEIGLEKIEAFHLNDALKGLGSRVDRHENIGKGKLGKELFRRLVNDPRFKEVPMCLETAPGDDDKNHLKEIRLLKNMRE